MLTVEGSCWLKRHSHEKLRYHKRHIRSESREWRRKKGSSRFREARIKKSSSHRSWCHREQSSFHFKSLLSCFLALRNRFSGDNWNFSLFHSGSTQFPHPQTLIASRKPQKRRDVTWNRVNHNWNKANTTTHTHGDSLKRKSFLEANYRFFFLGFGAIH